MDDLLSFRVYAPSRGSAMSIDRDGEVSLRLHAPGSDMPAVLDFLTALGVGGDGQVLRVVVVRDGESLNGDVA